MGQIAADAKATFGLVSGKASNVLFLNELFTGADAAPVARRSKVRAESGREKKRACA